MNCRQFEKRVQLLLDERSSLSLDLPIQKHAQECDSCHFALGIYEGMSGAKPSLPGSSMLNASADSDSVPLVSLTNSIRGQTWSRRQQQHRYLRLIWASAALLVVSLILVTQPERAPSAASQPAEVNLRTPLAIDVPQPGGPSGTSGLTTARLSELAFLPVSWTDNLSASAYVDLASLGRIDLVSWIPAEPVRAVRSLPATIESMEPIYRYSADLPVVNQWSRGIHYTIGLIQSSLPSPGTAQPRADKDMGKTQAGVEPGIC